jgi:hypothetical protein
LISAIFFGEPPSDGGFNWFDLNQLMAGHWLLLVIMTIILLLLVLPRSSTRPLEVARELLIVIPAVVLYDIVRGMVEGRESEAVDRALNMISIERSLGLFWELDFQRLIMGQRVVQDFMNFTYIFGMWPVIVLTGLWLFFRHRGEYARYRNAFLISGAIGLVIYATLPVAPPRFVDSWGFVDTVATNTKAYSLPDLPIMVNQYAAMPSLHFGWVFLSGIALVRHSRMFALKAAGVYMPSAMLVSILATGNHFILDAAAGGAVAVVGLLCATALRTMVIGWYSSSDERVPAFASQLF